MTGILYHTPAEIITQLLDDLGLADIEDTGTGVPLTGWTVFALHMPENPEQALVVKDTAGRIFGRANPDGVTAEHYGVQITARSSQDPATPYLKIKRLMEYFDTEVIRDQVTLYDYTNSVNRVYRVNSVMRVATAFPSGNDGRRFFFSGNFLASIEFVE